MSAINAGNAADVERPEEAVEVVQTQAQGVPESRAADSVMLSLKVRAMLELAEMLGHGGHTGRLMVKDKDDSNRLEINDDIEPDLIGLYDELADLPTLDTPEDWEAEAAEVGPALLRLVRAEKVIALLEIARFLGHSRKKDVIKSNRMIIRDKQGGYRISEEVALDLVLLYNEAAGLRTRLFR